MKREHTILLPVLHYLPVLGGFEVFLKNVVERVGEHRSITVITGRVAGVPSVEKKGKATIIRKASLYSLRDLSYSSYLYIFTALPLLFFYTLWYVVTGRTRLLYANGFFSGVVCLLVHWLTRVPYVMTIQSADFTIYHEEVGLNLIVRLQDWFEKQAYRHASVCHAVSNDLCRHYQNQGVKECVMIPNGVETALFRPVASEAEKDAIRERYGLPGGAFLISNISRLEPKNGVEELIDAVALLAPKHPDLMLVLVGDGSSRGKLEAHAEAKGIAAQVLFMGQIAYGDVGPLIAATDAFARTPRAEGFGIVFLEAMAAGLPTIGTRTGGIPDFIDHEVTGLLCEPRDVDSIAEALSRVITDAPLRNRLTTNASKMIHEHYDWDVIAREIEEKIFRPAFDKMH